MSVNFYQSLTFLVMLRTVGLATRTIPALPEPDLADFSHSGRPMGFKGSPFLLDLESVSRVVRLSFRSSIVGKKLYVGNLTYNVNEADLEALFVPFGTVQSAQIIVDRDTNRSKGFGFVEMDTEAQAQQQFSAQRSRARRAPADRQRGQATRRPRRWRTQRRRLWRRSRRWRWRLWWRWWRPAL